MSQKRLSRRNVLRGAGGIALALPWMESLVPRDARAQALPPPRLVAIYFPCGAGSYWKPTGIGRGAGWLLPPVLAPLAPVKDRVTVLSNVDNAGPFVGGAEPGHALLTGAFLTCTRATGIGPLLRNGISVDQVVARGIGGGTPLSSLQLGLATTASPIEDQSPALSRGISWASDREPLGRMVNPQAVFDLLVGGKAPTGDPTGRTRAADKNVLDYVMADATAMQSRLSRNDRLRLDAFLTSVRDVERELDRAPWPLPCRPVGRPAQAYEVGQVPADYSRDRHADVMIDLMVMALQCGLTRVISLMLDDARSDYVYGFLQERNFAAPAAPPRPVNVTAGLHDLASGSADSDAWATVTRWMVSKVARLAQQMAAVTDGSGVSLLDNSLIWFGSELHGQDHSAQDLPLLYVGGAGKRLGVDQHVSFPASQKLSDIYFTILRRGFGLPVPAFADGQSLVPAIVA